ncbi:MAG: hypothetical protein GF308_11505 [Candidatus Heimdallarchaeota archaeon]|nr:hypothetical protein [Candidatus Heimdallarchaeota archaeon]
MNKYHKHFYFMFAFSLIIMNFFIFSHGLGATDKGPINSCYTSTAPKVDGHLNPGEWDDANDPVEITLYNITDQNDTLIVEMQSVYTDNETVYLGITVPDSNLDDDQLMILFRSNLDEEFIVPPPRANFTYTKDNDVKMFWAHNNYSEDGYTMGMAREWRPDTIAGGTEDSEGKCHFTGSAITFELCFPFRTSDSNGHDISLEIGAEVEMFLYYYESSTLTEYLQGREADGDFDFNTLKIGCEPTTSEPPTTTTPPPTTTTPPPSSSEPPSTTTPPPTTSEPSITSSSEAIPIYFGTIVLGLVSCSLVIVISKKARKD